ncbi:MAG: Uma2 family endonuclease, partial [Pirellulaceae bacterium]|nr:Uma2 family endonuclease [Pirellulaceae bacterium]
MSLGFVRHKLSIDKYERMIRAGILTENDRVELIRGELLDKMPIGEAHVEAVNRLTRKFAKLLDESVTVSVQNPLVLADSEPEPDVALYTRRSGGKARAADVHLLVEVADSSLEFDRTVKLPLYAEAGIRELWIVNLIDERLEVYRQPQLDGTYADASSLQAGKVIEPLAVP